MKEINHLKSKLADGRITRRDFIRSAIALGIATPAAMSLSSAVLAATPKKGGVLRQALTGASSSDSLDPATYLDSYMINVGMGQLRNNLTEIDENNQLIPELAESWDTSDGQTWVFNLRNGVEFHNGRSLEANDVVASIQHHLGADTNSGAKGIVAQVQEISADGKSQVVMKLEGVNADFPYLMTDYHLGICPANADGTIDTQSGIGTGGYKLESHDPGVRTLTSRNPNYWKAGRAHFDGIETLFISDTGAREKGVFSIQSILVHWLENELSTCLQTINPNDSSDRKLLTFQNISRHPGNTEQLLCALTPDPFLSWQLPVNSSCHGDGAIRIELVLKWLNDEPDFSRTTSRSKSIFYEGYGFLSALAKRWRSSKATLQQP